MPKRPLYPLVNMALSGHLPDELAERRGRGDSFEDITVWLRTVDVVVSSETVRRWCHDLGLEPDRTGDEAA